MRNQLISASIRRLFLAVGLVTLTVAAVSCGSGDSTAATPTPAVTAGEAITVQGTVANVALSARVITLTEPDSGVTSIATTDSTELTFSDGRTAELRDFLPGVQIHATGRAGSPGSLLAESVIIE
jgi:hypothetical protein